MDRARVEPAAGAKPNLGSEKCHLEGLRNGVEHCETAMSNLRSRGQGAESARSLDEEWVAHWEVWTAARVTEESKSRLARGEELVARLIQGQIVDDLPLWEWNKLRNELGRD